MPEKAIFGHYEITTRDDGSLVELGRGAMGITYRAWDTSLECPVALKVINTAQLQSASAGPRLVREARALGHVTGLRVRRRTRGRLTTAEAAC